jgi:hypothetical protein
VCKNESDQRRLTGDVVKRLATQTALPIAPSGIRIIGAVFCSDLDLVGLNLPYSLVLDHSAFKDRIFARNVSMRGDFSIENGFAADVLILTRSRVDGSIYFSDGFIDRLAVFDTQVQGSWHQSNSVIFRDAEFHGLDLSGDIELSRSALRRLLLSSSKIQGGLYLNDSEARCAYQIKANAIHSVTIENGGFGAMVTLTDQNKPVLDKDGHSVGYAWWNQLSQVPAGDQGDRKYNSIRARLASQVAAQSIADEHNRILKEPTSALLGCGDIATAKNAEFHFFDNRVQSFCLRSFAWMSPNGDPAAQRSGQPATILALNGSNIASNLIVDFRRNGKHNQHTPAPELIKNNRFEALSVSMETLIFNFSTDSPEYITYLDGLKFNQVHDASLDCDYQQAKAEKTGIQNTRTSTHRVSQATRSRVGLPSVEAVKQWLAKNGADSSHPSKPS